MENEILENTLNISYQSIKSILNTIDTFIGDMENEKLKSICEKKISEYDLLLDECKLLLRGIKKDPEEVGFFEKYQNLINLKIASIKKKDTFFISEYLYLSTMETQPILYSLLKEKIDEIDIVKKLISINEDFISSLKNCFIMD